MIIIVFLGLQTAINVNSSSKDLQIFGSFLVLQVIPCINRGTVRTGFCWTEFVTIVWNTYIN